AARDRADRGHPGAMERFARDDECPTLAGLLVADDGVEVDDDDRPPKGIGHQSGQASAASNERAICAASSRNASSAAASDQRSASAWASTSRYRRSTAASTTASCELATPYRYESSRTRDCVRALIRYVRLLRGSIRRIVDVST